MGLFGAFIAAIAYGAGTIAQAIGVQRAAAATGGIVHKALAGWLFALGLVFDGLGYIASFAALRDLPLFLVESATASSVAVTAVLAVIILKQKLRRTEVIALGVVVAGLIMLSVSAEPGPAPHVPGWVGRALLFASIACGIIIPLSKSSVVFAVISVVFAVISGLGFAIVGLASRLLEIPAHDVWRVLEEPMAWSLIIGGIIAVVAYGMALDSGSATTVAAVSFSAETIVPSAIGLAFLGDYIRPGLGVVAALGFVATLGGCLALSSRAEVEVGTPPQT
ncbi:EamA family transporter [Corynebacterium falsenii]|uniref:DMT family transporter n=1 Tax=Corynebacterium falsenii TaxID=108486 RepID=UPI001CCB88FE|nr:DMT family transporter [Corynebacterium falsenii]UBI07354.1 EamA family transporter [Corynebacterium falsenii]